MPSTAIQNYSYSESEHELLIRYVGGGEYIYLNVPPDVYAGLQAARSRGAYVNAAIKPRYRYTRRDKPVRRILVDG